MPKWTESDISTFWEMKREGATLLEIAERLGRNYTAVATFSSKQTKKHKLKEDKPMTDEIMPKPNTAPEVPALSPELPPLNAAIRQALEMIAACGMDMHDLSVNVSRTDAYIHINFTDK